MSETVFDVQRRIGEVFKINGQPMLQPQFGESAAEFRQRSLCVAQQLLPRGHVWSGVDIRRQPERAFDSIEKALVHDRVEAFKAPVGELRSMVEKDRTGREIIHWYGDIEHTFAPFKAVTRRVTHIAAEMGTGGNSVQARAAAEAGRRELDLAYQALNRERAAAGIRE